MERRGISLDGLAKAALVLTLALALPAKAQSPGSAQDFQLPPGDPAQPPPAEGPLDPEKPVPVQNVPAPSPQPDPAPPAVSPAAPPKLVFPPLPEPPASPSLPRAAARAPAPAAEAPRRGLPAPAPSAQAPTAVPDEPHPAPSGVTKDTAPARTPASTPAPASPSFPPWIWWLAAGVLLLLLLAGIGFGLRRRLQSDDTENDWREEEQPRLVEEPVVPTRPTGSVRPPLVSSQVELVFEPERLTMALVNARLAYRLSLTNLGDAALGPVTIACDIISAHASLGAREQLLPGSDMVEPQHQLPSLEPGKTVSLAGELQLPIAAILPVRSGDASLFVPLARFRITALDAGRQPLVSTRVFIVGESPEQPGSRLRPIRMDLGPRTFSHISQREVETSA